MIIADLALPFLKTSLQQLKLFAYAQHNRTRECVCILICKPKNQFISVLLNQDISKGFDALSTIISFQSCIATRIDLIWPWYPLHTKPDSGINGAAIVLVVSKDTDSYPDLISCTVAPPARSVKTLSVTVELQRSLRPNQRLPVITTQRGCAIYSISNERVERTGLFVDGYKVYLITNSHTQTNFREICFPIRRQFGFLCVKSGLTTSEIVFILAGPKMRLVFERSLKDKLRLSREVNHISVLGNHSISSFLTSCLL